MTVDQARRLLRAVWEWLVVSVGIVDDCCECEIDVFPPVRGVMQSVVDEGQETEGPDLERKRQER